MFFRFLIEVKLDFFLKFYMLLMEGECAILNGCRDDFEPLAHRVLATLSRAPGREVANGRLATGATLN